MVKKGEGDRTLKFLKKGGRSKRAFGPGAKRG